MKGEWKNSVSGWNHKDSKRKKQTHNHRLKDNGRFIYHAFNGWKSKRKASPEIFRIENEVEKIMTYGEAYPDRYKEIKTVEAYYIYWYSKKYEAYNFKGTWYDLETYEEIRPFKSSEWDDYMVEPTIGRHIGTYEFDDTKGRESANRTHDFISGNYNQNEFMYGKPLPKWKWKTFYGDGKRRKYAQNRANRMDRRYIKEWINGHDISKPLKTHALSKSIAWEIW